MKHLDRRTLLQLAMASSTMLAADPTRSHAAEPPAAGPAPDTSTAWRRLFAGPSGSTFAWWHAGTLFAHVDGLREFPIVTLQSITLCRASSDDGAPAVDWRTIGYYGGLERGGPTSTWDNVFTGERRDIPRRFEEGPGQYRLVAGVDAPSLTLAARNVRTNRTSLTTSSAIGRVLLTQIEGTLQGLPGIDGALPPLGSPRVTERQTRLQLVAPLASLQAPPDLLLDVRGFLNHVYDALPDWLGFGERLGSALSRGVARKAGFSDVVDPTVWRTLRQLFPDAFGGQSLRLVP